MDVTAMIVLGVIAISGVMLKTFYDRGKKALSIFPELHTVTVVYRDKTAFGYAMHNTNTPFAGANKSIEIVVTDRELWLRSFLLFAGITQQHDLIHRIPLQRINHVKDRGNDIVLDFKNDKGQVKRVVINTRHTVEFLRSIGH